MNLDSITTFISTRGVDIALKLVGAILVWMIGRAVIRWIMGLVEKGITRGGKIDATLARYITSIISIILTIMLVMFLLSWFGIETTSFAALIAGAGLAIGTAWGGLLTHFAAGVFMQILRPFKVGDYVVAGGIEGTVQEVGLFGTTVLSPQNVTHIIGNNKVFGEVIQNFSAQPHRRVDATAKIANSVNPQDAIRRLQEAVAKIPNVKTTPAPEVSILSFTGEGPVLAVRPYCHTDHYWQVMFDTNRAITETFGAAGYPTPETPVAHRNV